jgi:hypothetical protein
VLYQAVCFWNLGEVILQRMLPFQWRQLIMFVYSKALP